MTEMYFVVWHRDDETHMNETTYEYLSRDRLIARLNNGHYGERLLFVDEPVSISNVMWDIRIPSGRLLIIQGRPVVPKAEGAAAEYNIPRPGESGMTKIEHESDRWISIRTLRIEAFRSIPRRGLELLVDFATGDGTKCTLNSDFDRVHLDDIEAGTYPPTPLITNEAAQVLMDSLWDCGIRPAEGKGSAGSLAATCYHLKDMQKLVWHLLPLATGGQE